MKKNEPSDSRPWHTFSPEATCEALTSTEQGLSQQEAERRLTQYGFNKLTPAASRGPLKRFFSQFHNVLIYVLLAAAGVTAAIEHWVDSGVIVGVVVINALIGFIQEGKAEKALDAIRNMLTLQAMVQRDGKRFLIPAEQLVPGDIVSIESGDKVPADLRLLQVKNLRADESMLTGESLPVEKNTAAVDVNAALRGSILSGLFGYLNYLRYCARYGRRYRRQNRNRPYQFHAAHGSATDHAAATADCRLQRVVDLCYFNAGLSYLRLWLVHSALFFDRFVYVGGGACRGRHSRRLAGYYDHYPGHRRTTHGQTQCHYPAFAGRRNLRLGDRHLFR